MSHFTPDSSKRKNNREKTRLKLRMKLEGQRTEFDVNASRPYKIVNTTFLSLSIRPFKANMIQSAMILLDEPMSKREFQRRLDIAFGVLKC